MPGLLLTDKTRVCEGGLTYFGISWVEQGHERSLSVCRAEDTEWERGSALRYPCRILNSKRGETLFFHQVGIHDHNILRTDALSLIVWIKIQSGVDHENYPIYTGICFIVWQTETNERRKPRWFVLLMMISQFEWTWRKKKLEDEFRIQVLAAGPRGTERQQIQNV